jgi:hypothetical protein
MIVYLTYQKDDPIGFQSHEGVPDLAEMQKVVGGLVEPVDLFSDEDGSVSLWLNEEGLIYDLDPSVHVLNAQYYGPDNPLTVRGDYVITRTNNHTGELAPMKETDFDRFIIGQKSLISFEYGLIPILEVTNDNED